MTLFLLPASWIKNIIIRNKKKTHQFSSDISHGAHYVLQPTPVAASIALLHAVRSGKGASVALALVHRQRGPPVCFADTAASYGRVRSGRRHRGVAVFLVSVLGAHFVFTHRRISSGSSRVSSVSLSPLEKWGWDNVRKPFIPGGVWRFRNAHMREAHCAQS